MAKKTTKNTVDKIISDKTNRIAIIDKAQKAIVHQLRDEGTPTQYGWTLEDCRRILARLDGEILDLCNISVIYNDTGYTPEYRQALVEELARRVEEQLLLGRE